MTGILNAACVFEKRDWRLVIGEWQSTIATTTALPITAIPNHKSLLSPITAFPNHQSPPSPITAFQYPCAFRVLCTSLWVYCIASEGAAPSRLTSTIDAIDTSTPGVALVTYNSGTPLPSGIVRFVRLTAIVPATAPYRAIHVLDLGGAFERYWDYRGVALLRLLEGRATSRDWCDDRTTPEKESCSDVLAGALNRALHELQLRYGGDRSKWRWAAAHRAFGEHRPFGLVGLLAPYFNVEVESPGGNYTLNRGKTEFDPSRASA